ncbi:MAG: tetratricopeptide repeat protein [Candidatus Obscuribacterales bacterium]|jgi:tetratricopeptide (TPR) repeat protein
MSNRNNWPKSLLVLLLATSLVFLESMPLQAHAKAGGANLSAPIEDKWAVVIGIGDFVDPSIPKLKYSSKDARDFYDYLVDPAQGKFKPDHVRLLLDKNATKINIMDALGDSFLPHAANPKDLVVIYLSTHGSPAGADIRGVNYVVAYDTQVRKLFATGIEMNQLLRMIKERVHTNRIVLVLDTCYSGAGAQLGHKGIVRTNVDSHAAAQGVGSLVISSSSPDQKAWESDDLHNSYFTRYFIDALKETGSKADKEGGRGNGINIEQAFNTMRSKVQSTVLKDKGEVQTPVMAGVFSGPSLLLSTPPTVNREAPTSLPGDGVIASATPGSRSIGSAGALDFSAYVEHVRLGNQLVEQNKTWDAIHEFELATKANPGTIEGYITLAQLYDQQGRSKEMLDAARRAVLNDESSSRGRELLSLADLRAGNVEESLRQVQMAITLDPFNSMAHNLLGYINEHKFNRVDQAEQEYRKALELNNLNTRALVNLGLLLEKHGRDKAESETLFRKAIESDGDDWEAHLSLGHLLYETSGKLAEAEKEIRRAIELAPANARIHSELGNILALDKKRLEESEVELKKGIELGSDKGTPHYLFANFLLNQRGRIDEAEREYRKAILMDPNYDQAMVALADCLLNYKKIYNESDDLYKRALKVNLKNASAHLGIARVQELLFKNYKGAEEEIRAALAIDPRFSLAHERLGVLLEKLGKPGDARLAYQAAIDTDPDNAQANYLLAILVWEQFHNSQEAKKLLERATALQPLNSTYLTAMGKWTAIEAKQYKDAEKLLRKATEINFADTQAHYQLGMLLIEKLGARKAGEAELKTAYEQNPEDKLVKAAYSRFVR